jgi:hypothetical protein
MKLKPTQMIGLAAIIVFGSGMIYRMTQPSEREIMEQRLASLPRVTASSLEFPVPDLSMTAPVAPVTSLGDLPPAIIPPVEDLTLRGSQAAKDDLYCSAMLGAEFNAKINTAHPDTVAPLLDAQKRLDTAGIAKLKTDGLTDGSNWASYTLAYEGVAAADYAAGTLRISVADCTTRAAALPRGDLY